MSHSLCRRSLLVGSASLLWGCRSPSQHRTATSAAPSAPAPTPPPPRPGVPAAADVAPVCRLTEANIEGPFYKPGAPARARLVERTERLLVVEGRVLDDRCQPIPHAVLDVWQADPRGDYDDAGFALRGRLGADHRGHYRFETVRPGHYLNGDRHRPAHIHVKVAAPEHHRLTTQLYFPDDPHNADDPFILPSLIMDLRDASADELARFDFVLARA